MKRAPPIFRGFLDACEATFSFLADEFGFRPAGHEVHGYECSMLFSKPPNVSIMVLYEPGATPTVSVFTRLKPESKGSIETQLAQLARRRVENWVQPRLEPGNHSREGLREVLEQYAALLRDSFPDILEGADGIGTRLKSGT